MGRTLPSAVQIFIQEDAAFSRFRYALRRSDQPDARYVDLPRFRVLLARAVQMVLAPIQQSVHGGKDDECLYLFLLKKYRAMGDGDTQKLGNRKYHRTQILTNKSGGES